MAYPTVSAPYGYKPVNLIGGQPYAGSTRNLPIAYNQSGAIYYGDPVVITSGFAVLPSLPVNSTNVIVGYFAGCYYTSPTTKQRLYSQYYPGSVTAGDITAIVVDDPDVVLKAAVTTTGATTLGFRVLNLVPDTQVAYGATYVSGTGTTSLVVSGLAVGTYLPIGTDVFNVVNGQLQFTGSSLTAASTIVAGNNTLTVTASTATVSGTLAIVQTPEVLVKTNFGCHRYNLA